MSTNIDVSTAALFADFDAASTDDWVAAARVSLRGRPLESLIARSYEGIDIQPLPHADSAVASSAADSLPGQFPFLRGSTANGYRAQPWLIANQIDIADPDDFNAALKIALANGQTAIMIGEGLRLDQASDIRRALADIDLKRFPLLVWSGGRAPEINRLLQEALSPGDLRRLRGCVGYDPLSVAVCSGSLPTDAFETLAAHVKSVNGASPQLGSISVDATAYHEAGANAVQELAVALAIGVAYLRELGGRGLAVELISSKIRVCLGIGENFFMEVAKFRAIKLLWAQMLRAFGLSARYQRLQLHARGGLRNKTRRDRHVNLLRLTSEALAAALGGVDSVCLPAFDAPLGASDALSRRLSRNLQLILQEEAQLTQLIDPAGGAWHVETLTDQLARKAWARFQDIEAQGGMLAALQSGKIQAEIEAVAERRRRDLAAGESILVGANAYVNEAESLPAAREPEPSVSGETGADALSIDPLTQLRLAEDFEMPQPEAGAEA